jgi:hypothetical protein
MPSEAFDNWHVQLLARGKNFVAAKGEYFVEK